MKIVPGDLWDESTVAFMAEAVEHYSPIRSPGIHVSDIIKVLKDKIPGIGGSTSYPDTDVNEMSSSARAQLHSYFILGLAWEEVVLNTLHLQYGVDKAPPEQVVDGIVLNPDGLWLAHPVSPRIIECKFTFKSLRTSKPESVWDWKVQTMAYCKGWGINTVEFRNMYAAGDYRENRKPTPFLRVMEYTQEEIDSNWEMMLRGRDYLRESEKHVG